MFEFPDLRPLFYFAVIGIIVTCLAIVAAVSWGGYHLWRMFILYMGS